MKRIDKILTASAKGHRKEWADAVIVGFVNQKGEFRLGCYSESPEALADTLIAFYSALEAMLSEADEDENPHAFTELANA